MCHARLPCGSVIILTWRASSKCKMLWPSDPVLCVTPQLGRMHWQQSDETHLVHCTSGFQQTIVSIRYWFNDLWHHTLNATWVCIEKVLKEQNYLKIVQGWGNRKKIHVSVQNIQFRMSSLILWLSGCKFLPATHMLKKTNKPRTPPHQTILSPPEWSSWLFFSST